MSEKENKNVIKEFLLTIIAIIVFAWIFFVFVTYLSVYHASDLVKQPSQQEYMRVRIYGSSSSADGNTISGAFAIVDSAGNEIAEIERSWSGNYLSVDFVQSTFKDKIFLFPYRIYGKERIMETMKDRRGGTILEKYYNDNYQCLLLGYGSSLVERQDLYKISKFATKNFKLIPSFGHISVYTIDLSECKNDVYYSIQILNDGRIVVTEI